MLEWKHCLQFVDSMLQPSCARVCGMWYGRISQTPTSQCGKVSHSQLSFGDINENTPMYRTIKNIYNSCLCHNATFCQGNAAMVYVAPCEKTLMSSGSNNFLFCWLLYLVSRGQMLVSYDIYNYWWFIKYSYCHLDANGWGRWNLEHHD